MTVLIIGGGLAGPALALALRRRSIGSIVFEVRPTRSDSGGSISLAPNALLALDKVVGVYDRVKAEGFLYNKLDVWDETGYRFGEISQSEAAYPSVRILRSQLHKVLVEACEAEGIEIVYGARLDRIEDGANGVTAHFKDGTRASGDLLVGADGIHSQVRDHVLGPASPSPIFSGSMTVNGFLPRDAIALPKGFTLPAACFTPCGLVMVIPNSPDGQRVAWGASKAMTDRSRAEWKALETSGEASRMVKSDYESISTQPIRSLLDNADDSSSRLWAPYSIPTLPTWHRGRVCLIGDAQTARPIDHDRLFATFETRRRARLERVGKLAKAAGGIKSKTGPVAWYFKRWLIWAFFGWKGWVVRNPGITLYDVTAESLDIT